MAFKFSLVRPDGAARPGYFGFAWTTLFFGPLAPIGRKDFSIAFLTMALEIIFCLLVFWYYDRDAYLLAARLAIVSFCWALLYNEIHALNLLIEGFRFHGSDEVVAALNNKFSATGRAERLRLLRERSLVFVAAGLGILQISSYLLPKVVTPLQKFPEARFESPTTPARETNRPPAPATSAEVAIPASVTPPSPAAVAPIPEVAQRPVAGTPSPAPAASPSPAAEAINKAVPKEPPAQVVEKVPVRSDAEIRAEQQYQCDIAMGSQFDSDLPKNVTPIVDTSVLSEMAIDQAIASCDGARRGPGRRFNTQLGRAYAAKAVLLATKSDDRGARENMDQAVQQWKAAERQGSGAAMNFLGAYYKGTFNSVSLRFLLPDYSRALEYWLAGEKAGNPKAARNAGGILLLGPSDYPPVPQDIPRAITLLEKAIRGGDLAAAATYGQALYYGDPKGVPKEMQRGLSLLARACAGNDSTAKAFYDREIAKQKKPTLVRPDGC
jgi:TPR repeat protein